MTYFINTSYPNFEIIVVDNASNDQSLNFLRNMFDKIRVISLDENKGFAEGANIGAKESKGKILAFMNNDIEVHPDWLTNAIATLLSDERIGAVQCKIMQFEKRDVIDAIGHSVDKYGIVRMIGHDEIDTGQYNDIHDIGACSGGAMVIRKELFFELGCFDSHFFMYYEDVDLSWRIKLAGYKIMYANSSVVYHVGSGTADVASASIGFHLVKNHITSWLKNSRLRIIVVYWPVLLFIILGWISFNLLRGRIHVSTAQLKGMLWPIKEIKYILQKRNDIKKFRRIHSDDLLFVTSLTKRSTNLLYVIKRHIPKLKRCI